MTIIVPISEMEDTSKMQELCRNEPIIITENGHECMVVLNMQSYNEFCEKSLDLDLQENYKKSLSEGGNAEAKQFLMSLYE